MSHPGGPGTLTQLNGMFAFAWADEATGRWILARDPFGIKPLYDAQLGDSIVFASEIKALLAHGELKVELDRAALQQYLTFQFCLGGRTLFKGIFSSSPGFISRGRLMGAASRPSDIGTPPMLSDSHHTPEYFRDGLAALIADSARLQVRSDVPLGGYLSGGLDSSVVVAAATRQMGGRLPVFHGRFAEGRAYDESVHARAIARHRDGEYHEVVPTAEDFVECLPGLIRALDEPVGGPGLFPQFMVSRAAS